MTIMLQTGPGSLTENDKEHCIKLPIQSYEALSSRRLEISSQVSAHIIWDNENSSIVLLGSDDTVHQTARILHQYLSSGPRRLVGRSLYTLNTINSGHHQTLDQARSLLLMSQLPPELSISSNGQYSQFSGLNHSPLGRTVSDSSHSKLTASSSGHGQLTPSSFTSRRKLENEDSSYDSDHENLTGTLSADPSHVSHDDVSRCYSETLAQEFSEYVSTINKDVLLNNTSFDSLSPHSAANSREASPSDFSRQCDLSGSSEQLNKDQYMQKVEFALKLGYEEKLTRKALQKIGPTACNDDLLNELIRLQQFKVVDPKEDLLKESCGELVQSTLATEAASSKPAAETVNTNLRPIVIDGSNVAMSHGKEVFSCVGIQIAVDWFRSRGHTDVKVFLPKWRTESSKPESPITGQYVLQKLEKEKILYFTPSRQVGGRRIVSHDDKYILNLAAETGAIVVSNDHYRELINEKKEFKKVIEERILPYVFVEDKFMPPDDPLGRNGPSLSNFLKGTGNISLASATSLQPCPYDKKCTYGNKCKFYHPDRGNAPMKTVTDKLKEQSKRQIQEVRTRNTSRDSSPGELVRAKSMNLQLRRAESDVTAFTRKQPGHQVSRTMSSRPHGVYQDYHHQMKAEVAKSKSVETSRLQQRDSEALANMEMGCLSSYGQPPPHLSQPWPGNVSHMPQFGALLSQPPPATSHRKLERQLTINPSFDPRINKQSKLSPLLTSESPLLTSEAIDYMHRNPPPPIGLLNISEQSELSHRDVTRNASAPDSIKHWSRVDHSSGPMTSQTIATVDQPLSTGAVVSSDQCSPTHRPSSGSDTQLDRVMNNVNRTFSADPFTTSDTWKYSSGSSISPLLGPSIWGAPDQSLTTTPVSLLTSASLSPPVSPVRNLGPVGSRPNSTDTEVRTQQFKHLCNIFPEHQVLEVMKLMPHEKDSKRLSAKIIEMFPPN